MLNAKRIYVIIIVYIIFCQNLFSQIVITGTVWNNGSEYVKDALVELLDQVDTTRIFSGVTNAEGKYLLQIPETGIGDAIISHPSAFNLLQNYPNPFNPSTVISYELPYPAHIRIDIYNVLGQKIKTLFEGIQSSCYGKVMWDGTNEQGQGVSAGVYFYNLNTNGVTLTRKMLLLDGHSGIYGHIGPLTTASILGSNKALNKVAAGPYMLRVSGSDIETYFQHNLLITENTTIDVIVYRTVTDFDGNVYQTVKIGNQWWMAENLHVTHFRNGDTIPIVHNNSEWIQLATGACCYYDNNSSFTTSYGNLYNWYAVNDNRSLAPIGWHIPTDSEWIQLEIYLGMSLAEVENWGPRGTDQGGKLKETGTEYWLSPNTGATNSSGFTARSGGYRDGNSGNYNYMGNYAFYWSATEDNAGDARRRLLVFNSAQVYRDSNSKKYGFSIRCIMD